MKELIEVQQQIVAKKGHKDQRGTFSYRTAEDILTAYKSLLASRTCTLTMTNDVVEVGRAIFVKCTARFSNEKGETVESSAYAEIPDKLAAMSAPQITGSCTSYAMKRALGNLFLLEDGTADPDNQIVIEQDDKTVRRMIDEATTTAQIEEISAEYPYLVGEGGKLRQYCATKYNVLKKQGK